ncbi:MAG: sulfatase [Planctomycetaceae bacterium]|nr:sulfatase [Planctomycetaceae bacterium]
MRNCLNAPVNSSLCFSRPQLTLSSPILLPALLLLVSGGFPAPVAHADEVSTEAVSTERPNVIVIFADDLGWGDLSCYGHPTIRTPHLDRMAAEGVRFTQFYSGASVCTPSRAALLTGRLPVRSGMCSDRRRVLFPDSDGGLPASEVTLAEALKDAGYATTCVGKWHLGHLPAYLPTQHGFDSYFGVPYSNDMDRVAGQAKPKGRAIFLDPKVEYWNVPLMQDEQVIERPAEQTTITRRYAERAVSFIRENKERPFFLYLAHNLPHVPLFRSPEFEGTSRRGLYGDVIEEIDAGIGRILDEVRAQKLEQKTIVWFTSDNGPWLIFGDHGGSAGLLRDGKGCTYEGGMREPAIAWWPGTIPGGRISHELATTMDIFTTSVLLGGGQVPNDREIDGVDLRPALTGTGPSPRKSVFYYRGTRLMAVRLGPWKAHYITQAAYGGGKPVTHDVPVLYHLEHDPSERHDRAADHPEVLAEIARVVEEHRQRLKPLPTQLERRIGQTD